jgi:protein phosphatase
MTSSETAPVKGSIKPDRQPRDDEVDIFGLTHTGKVRKVNQDHFMICSLHKEMKIHHTSLPSLEELPFEPERLATLAVVADGVGSGWGGEEASRLAVATIAQYVAESMRCYYTEDATKEQFSEALEEAAMQCHASVMERAQADPDRRGMATTLTLWIGVWPRSYLLQVGDSRAYAFHNGRLTQISRDQTMAEELIDQGVLTRTGAHETRWAHVLSSSIGGAQTAPVVTSIELAWHNVGLICSDGLTKHVTDKQIRERLRTMTSAKQVCEDLLQDALDGGGSDNITIVVARAVPKESV